jgi:uncharacterized Zn finger protein (UPF0148 family)
MNYATVTCSRCGKSFLTSNGATLCLACQHRKANGVALAQRRKEAREEERGAIRADFAFLFNERVSG